MVATKNSRNFMLFIRNTLTKEFLIEHYVNKKLSMSQIAKQVNCAVATIRDYMQYFDIPRNHLNKYHLKPGQQIFNWKLIKRLANNKQGPIWLCECKCGKKQNVVTNLLNYGRSKSCRQCSWNDRKGSTHQCWKGYGEIGSEKLSKIRTRARRRYLDFNLTCKFLSNLWLKQNKKCAISGLQLDIKTNASVDRIDSSLGYVKGNVWWVHSDINQMKWDFNFEKFLEYCKIIFLFNKEKANINDSVDSPTRT